VGKRGRKRIVLVGGGSNAWTPNIVKDMLLTPAIAGSTFVLYDIDREAAERAAAFLVKLDGVLGTGSAFVATSDRDSAFDGADYFIITISTGGLSAMAHDLALPEAFGIWHTVGDTAGPGGWARSVRNFPVFEDLAHAFNRRAPGAMILNYTNPLTVLTAVLSRLCTGPVVGLCHGLFENLEFLTAHYGLRDESELSVSYAGVNHFFWMNRVSARGRDVLPDLLRKVRRRGFTSLLRDVEPDPAAYSDHRELATALFDETGILPYLGDRHTCEFFPCYITSKAAMRKYRLVRTSIGERQQAFRQRARDLRAMTEGEIPGEYTTRSRETAADIIAAHITGKAFIDVGNVANIGQISNLPRGAVVETAVRVDSNGFSPICFGDLPRQVLGLVEPVVHAFETTISACMERDRALALQALRLDPVCAHLTGDEVKDLGSRLIGAHRKYMEGLFRPNVAGRVPRGARRASRPPRRRSSTSSAMPRA
jgi:alpha-galactosidase/6-phospho-beta-glucosidase family protein